MPKVNPDILRWARETAGLTLEEASQKLRILDAHGVSAVDRLIALEKGEDTPTRPMLTKMAKQYRRPLVVFYMSKPPQKGNRGQDFRTLPEEYSIRSDALVDALIRDVQTRQSIIRAALIDEDEAEPLPFVGSMSMADGATAILESIKKTINVDINEFRRQNSPEEAFTLLRSAVEAKGIFVLLIGDLGSHHTAIDIEVFRGFSLADNVAPFIIINDRDSRAAWSFTLIHELVHIWLGQTGISNSYHDKAVEKFCNEVAGEVLLPKEELASLHLSNDLDFEEIKTRVSDFASSRNISSSMVAYTLFRTGKINRSTWQNLNTAYRALWNEAKQERRDKAREKKGGPDYYVVRRHRVGTNLISLVKRLMFGGALTTTKAGIVLGIKAKNVQKLIESIGPNNAS